MKKLKNKPFYLKDDAIEWVEKTLNSMSEEEKIGQLFCLIGWGSDEEYLLGLTHKYKIGGLMCRPSPAVEVIDTVKILQENSCIPMLIAANLEKGGNGIAAEGTFFGTPMQVAATNNEMMAARLGEICGMEGAAVGCNWSFAPIIDVDYCFRNPITNTRTFGSNPDLVKRMGVQYVNALQKHGLAASIKHFPGDGVDERDQHLVTAINSLSCEEWDASYGMVYKACIEAGAMTVMAGHIMQPAYSKKFVPDIRDEDILPATLSYELVTQLLKEQLGFNGLVVTDASTMAGMQIPMPRSQAVPRAIAAGCDMFLFARNLEEDYEFMKLGVQNGVITQERLNEAVMKILALKAALGLHEKQAQGKLVPQLSDAMTILGNEIHKQWAQECADQAITLVKSKEAVLPISPEKSKKILYYGIEASEGFAYSVKVGVIEQFKNILTSRGFVVDQFVPKPGMEGMVTSVKEVTEQYDLIIYLVNMATKSNQTTVRIEWEQPMGANVPIYMTSVPTIFISVENPYHLLDAPRVRTYINTYGSQDPILDLLADKLMGKSEFKGISPVDAFCGKWDTHL